jgi:hypothetical protein
MQEENRLQEEDNVQVKDSQKSTCIFSILALIFGFIFSIVGIIFGIIALYKIKRHDNLKGKGMAIAGIIIGIFITIIVFIFSILPFLYMGVFSPSRYIPEACTLNAPFGCQESSINTDSVTLTAKNSIESTITLNKFSISGCGKYSEGPLIIPPGSIKTIRVLCDTELSKGEKFSGNVEIGYLEAGGVFNKTSSGNIMGKVS